ncbi:MAG: efflux RND transporter permease subunit [Armatimonadetes bacterium]|nr:efflux RND transporter permease subunit [Armatimonadota bacterium]
MWLTNLAIKRPVVILMLFMALAVLGIKSRSEMPLDLNPKVDIPYVVISTVYPGAGPEEIETLVSKPLEDAIGSVNGLKNISSTSQEGVSIVTMEFELGTNLDVAVSDVRGKVDAARRTLPDDSDSPVIQKIDIGAQPILYMGISSKRPPRELRQLVDDVIKDRLGKLKGVASVNVTGGELREIQINVDKNRLEAYGLSISQVSQALAAGNLNLPSGRIKEGGREYAVRAVGEFSSVDEIRGLKISISGGSSGSRVLTIGDIAEVRDSIAEREENTRLERQDSVGITVQKQSDANTVEVADAVKKELDSMKVILPADVKIAISMDQSSHVREAIADVNTSLWLGAILAVLIVFLFLHNIRGTFIVAIAIPTSIVATFIPIRFAGFTMNSMVMLALSLAVGILVDDSIVVLENIYRHLRKGEEPAEAALNGRSEIGLAAITITAVDMVVFLPIAFMGGIVGMFFKQFGITVATATAFSLLVSFTLTPMLASRWYRKAEDVEASTGFFAKFDEFYHMLDRKYSGALSWALGHRWQVLTIGIVVFFAVMLTAGPKLGFEFFPQSDQGQVGVTVEMPTGTSLIATDAVVSQIEDMVSEIPEAEHVFTNVGSTHGGVMSTGGSGANYGQITITLREKESVMDRLLRPLMRGERKRIRRDTDIAALIREQVKGIAGGRVTVSAVSGMGGGWSPIDIELTGDNMDELNAVSQKIRAVVASTEGTVNPDVSWKVGKPEITATIDRIRAAEMGFSVGQIASALRTSIEGSTDTKYRENGKEYDIRVRLSEFDRYNVSDVGRVVIGAVNGMPVFLQDVAKIAPDTGPTKIERKNRQRKVSVTASLLPGYPLGNVQNALKKGLEGVPLGNTQLFYGGQSEMMAESFGYMFGALILAILLVYMLMAALFESLFNPFIIMFSLPMALIGAILALVMTGETLSIVSMIGFIMLMGLVTKNAILLVDYTNTLRARGLDRTEAVLQAGPTRLRPILMTTLAMIGGMLPTALKLGRGSETRAPMAIAVIGGLIVSTLLTLIIIPTLYTVFDDMVGRLQARKDRLLGRRG